MLIFAASWLLQGIGIYRVAGNVDNPAVTSCLIAAMSTPTLGVLALMWVSKPDRAEVLWRVNLRVFTVAPYAVFIPTLVAFTIITIFSIMNWGHSSFFSFSSSGVHVLAGRWLLGKGEQSWVFFSCNIVGTAVLYSLVGMIFGAGEQLGLRGYLQGRLIAHYGLSKGIAILGLLWSFWHLPLLLAGYNCREHRYLGAFLFLPGSTRCSVIFYGVAHSEITKSLAGSTGTRSRKLHPRRVDRQRKANRTCVVSLLDRIGGDHSVGLIFWSLLVRNRTDADEERQASTSDRRQVGHG